MAKAGMRRPSPYDADNHGTENHHKMNHPKNEQAQVPEIQGAAKNGNAKAGPINAPNWARDDYKTGEHKRHERAGLATSGARLYQIKVSFFVHSITHTVYSHPI